MPLRSYRDDPALLARVLELLRLWREELPALHARAAELGASWAQCSAPFVRERGGQLLAHVGVVERALRVAGEDVRIGGLHAVFTHPEHRRRGLFAELAREALAHCDARYPAVLLSTDAPELYEPLGFRRLREHRFELAPGAAVAAPVAGEAPRLRSLELGRAQDRALLARLLAQREPLSERLGVRAGDPAFAFAAGLRPLYYSASLDAALLLRREPGALHLEDVVTPRLPALGALLEQAALPGERVCLHFTAERFAPQAEPAARRDGDVLMARGALACEAGGAPFILPPSART